MDIQCIRDKDADWANKIMNRCEINRLVDSSQMDHGQVKGK